MAEEDFCKEIKMNVNNDDASRRKEEQGHSVMSSPHTGFWPATLGDENNGYLIRSEMKSNCLAKTNWNYQKDLHLYSW